MFGRGQHSAVEQLAAIEGFLPFPWLGLDSNNGGEFILNPAVGSKAPTAHLD